MTYLEFIKAVRSRFLKMTGDVESRYLCHIAMDIARETGEFDHSNAFKAEINKLIHPWTAAPAFLLEQNRKFNRTFTEEENNSSDPYFPSPDQMQNFRIKLLDQIEKAERLRLCSFQEGDLLISENGGVIIKLLSDPDNFVFGPTNWVCPVEFMESADIPGYPEGRTPNWSLGRKLDNFCVQGGWCKWLPLRDHYIQQVSQQFDFDNIKQECLQYITFPGSFRNDGNEPIGHSLIGSILTLSPSGKYYLPFACSNVTEFEARKDELWNEAMEEVFAAHNLYLTSGEGSGLDIFACRAISWEELAEHHGYEGEDVEALVRENVREV